MLNLFGQFNDIVQLLQATSVRYAQLNDEIGRAHV